MVKKIVIVLIVCFVSNVLSAQELKWKITRTESGNEKFCQYDVTLTQTLSAADCAALNQAFSAKEEITVLQITPGTNRVIIKASKNVRATDVRDIILMAGFQVEPYSSSQPVNR
jgi:hypothetical protein